MRKDAKAELAIRKFNKLTKKELRHIASWLRRHAFEFDRLTKGNWLVMRKGFSSRYTLRLMK